MSFVGMLKTSTLFTGLMAKNPGVLSLNELDQMQQFVNKGRSMILLENHPQLEGIFSVHALEDRNKVVDILMCFLEEGGAIGSTAFKRMVDNMVAKGMLTPAITDVLERSRFLLPGHVPALNADGVLQEATS